MEGLSGQGRARERAWAQLVDVLAQTGAGLNATSRNDALAKAREVRPLVPEAIRSRTAAALSGLNLTLDVFLFLAEDRLSVSAPVLLRGQMSDSLWEVVLPRLSVPARALVRQRRDLSPTVHRLLDSFGAADFALPPAQHRSQPDAASGRTFVDLLARIKQGRATRRAADTRGPLRAFRFVTGSDGMIRWVDCRPNAALVGWNLGQHLKPSESDGATARSPLILAPVAFRELPLSVPGSGAASGDWCLDGIPCFSPDENKFLGFRGIARRVRAVQDTNAPDPASGSGASLPDGLRQFIHELRTPLNAVRGFAELMAAQMLGPVSQAYQALAHQIVADAEAVADLLDDLPFFVPGHSVAAADHAVAHNPVDAAGMMIAAFEKVQPLTVPETASLEIRAEPDLPQIRADPDLLRRLAYRFAQILVALSGPLEQMSARFLKRGSDLLVSVRRPIALRDIEAAALYDPDRAPAGEIDHAPFGIAYGFRLIWALARATGGQFEISRQSLTLHLKG